jgi:hypothetical protein
VSDVEQSMNHLLAHPARAKFLDIPSGLRLFRSRDVPVGLKVGSLTIGVLLTFLLTLLEVPLEGIVALLLPLVGTAIDVAIDGAEFVLLPLLLGAAMLPHFVAKRRSRE